MSKPTTEPLFLLNSNTFVFYNLMYVLVIYLIYMSVLRDFRNSISNRELSKTLAEPLKLGSDIGSPRLLITATLIVRLCHCF